MPTFKGAPLSHEVAEDMFIGWMDPERGAKPFSWLVAAGKNPAYDYFPCQHQLFYRGKGGMWWVRGGGQWADVVGDRGGPRVDVVGEGGRPKGGYGG